MTDAVAPRAARVSAAADNEMMAWDSRARRVVTLWLPLCCFIIVLLFPFYWMSVTAFKPDAELYDFATNTFTASGSTASEHAVTSSALTSTGKVIQIDFGPVGTEAWDLGTGTWTDIVDSPTPVDSAPLLRAHDGRIYAFGGGTSTGDATNAVSVFDPQPRSGSTWVLDDSSTCRHHRLTTVDVRHLQAPGPKSRTDALGYAIVFGKRRQAVTLAYLRRVGAQRPRVDLETDVGTLEIGGIDVDRAAVARGRNNVIVRQPGGDARRVDPGMDEAGALIEGEARLRLRPRDERRERHQRRHAQCQSIAPHGDSTAA